MFEQWTAANIGVKVVAAPGESRWFAAAGLELISERQRCWDRSCTSAGNVAPLSYPNNRVATLKHRFFVRSKIAARADAQERYSLENLYAMESSACA